MLSRLNQDVAHCYQRAAECAERAGTCANAEMRAFYLDREKAWNSLGRSYQAAERVSRKLERRFGQFTSRKFLEWPATARVRNCPSCKVETTVTCDGLVVCPNCQRIVDQVIEVAGERKPVAGGSQLDASVHCEPGSERRAIG
jgi:hypothetical protein